MLKAFNTQLRILIVHGVLAFCLGGALLYLAAGMTNPLFEAVSVVLAILMASAALLLGALADWVAAWGDGTRHLQRSAFYLLSGLAFATAGAYLGIYAPISLEWLLLLAAIHALAFGLLGIAIALREKRHGWEQRIVFLFGAASIAFSGALAGIAKQLNNHNATWVLGVYFCFVGVKLAYLAWSLHRRIADAEGLLDSGRDRVTPLAVSSSPSPAK
ncbi:MAG: hypothetical protein JOZ83_12815 [Silvibacterium sp.]|nr:hypothetical protein [Silvibacterium sp.]